MHEAPPFFEIRVQGHLAPRCLRSLEDLITHQPNGETVLAGPISDQSTPYCLLLWLHNIGVPLLSVRRIEERG